MATEPSDLDSYGGTKAITAGATGFFRVEKVDGRWWLITPEGHGFISVGLNHADETDLKYPRNIGVWKSKYGSRDRWIRGVAEDLKSWGFNTLGWTQQWVTGQHGLDFNWVDPLNLGHSLGWSLADIQATGMPYVLQLRVAAIEQWNGNPVFPDVFSDEFEEHCAYLAREHCTAAADDPNLIGYFLTDIPAWLPHASGGNFAGLPGSKLGGPERTLTEVATKYYETINRHVRAYDQNHLILGDRYNGNMGIPAEVLEAARPFIDVLSVQYFAGNDEAAYAKMRDDLARWSDSADLPVIIADIGNSAPTRLNPDRFGGLGDQAARGRQYVDSFNTVAREPWFIGWHWCSYIENEARGWGLKDENDEEYKDMVGPMTESNRAVYKSHLGNL
jgi:hypothetical protein